MSTRKDAAPRSPRLDRGGVGVSANTRKARFYTHAKQGRKQLATETKHWRRLTAAIAAILGPEA